MIQKRNLVLGLVLCLLCLTGCDRGGITLDGEAVNGVQVLSEEAATEEAAAASGPALKSDEEEETAADRKAEEHPAETETAELTVHVCGAVNAPGVYVLQAGARLYEAIAMAEGFAAGAAEEYLNLALPIEDGMQIAVPTSEEVEELAKGDNQDSPVGIRTAKEASGAEVNENNGKVNLNTAGKAELMTLPGIGEARAEAILSYREQNGKFRSKEELMNVTGIKEASYGKLEQYITVSE